MNYYERHQCGRWRRYELMGPRGSLPRFAGVYAVYFDEHLVYLGSSVDIANRFSEHRIRFGYAKNLITPWGDVSSDTRITLKVKRSRVRGDWAMWEIRLIHRLQPMFNRQHRGRKAA